MERRENHLGFHVWKNSKLGQWQCQRTKLSQIFSKVLYLLPRNKDVEKKSELPVYNKLYQIPFYMIIHCLRFYIIYYPILNHFESEKNKGKYEVLLGVWPVS